LNSSKTVAVAGLTFGSMLLSVLFVGACGMRTLEAEHINANGRMGQANWDFSQSFATNVTIIGSVLTAIWPVLHRSARALPDFVSRLARRAAR